MDGLGDRICKDFKRAKKRKHNWDELYEEAQCYISPNRESFDEEYDFPGLDKSGRGLVYDSTAIDAAEKFVSNLQSSLVPPQQVWSKLKPGPLLAEASEAEDVMANVTNILFNNLHNSNFDTQASEAFKDLLLGTGALLVYKGTKSKPFNFVNVPLSQLYLEEGVNSRPETAYRYWLIEASNIEGTWEDAEIGEEIKEIIKEKPDTKIRIIEKSEPGKVMVQTAEGEKEVDGFIYRVVTEKDKKVIVERKQRSSPWVIFRWSVTPGEVYGRGPGLFALPDIKTLNKTKELLLKAASVNIFGMYTVADDGEISVDNIKLGPAAMITVSSNEGSIQGPTIAPLKPSSDINLAQLVINDMRNTINNMFFADPLGPIDLPVKTATEISLRQQELAKRIGSAFGRLQFEFIQPLLNRLLDILDDLELIDIGEFRVDGNALAIEHTSPLKQSQEEEKVIAISRYMEMIAGMYGPEALAVALPLDKFVLNISEMLNIPEGMVPSQADFDEAKAAAMQIAQQQMQGEMPVE